jgi:hypothetical protein
LAFSKLTSRYITFIFYSCGLEKIFPDHRLRAYFAAKSKQGVFCALQPTQHSPAAEYGVDFSMHRRGGASDAHATT